MGHLAWHRLFLPLPWYHEIHSCLKLLGKTLLIMFSLRRISLDPVWQKGISSDRGRQGTTDYEKRGFVMFVIIRYIYNGMNFINNFLGSMWSCWWLHSWSCWLLPQKNISSYCTVFICDAVWGGFKSLV